MTEDTLGWMGVLISGTVITFTNFYIIDSIISILIGIIVLKGAYSILKDTSDILLESVPKTISLKNVIKVKWSKETEKKYMRISHYGLNPVSNDLFASRKSAFKVIQYYRAGIIPIVSDVGINKGLIKEYGGFVIKNMSNFIFDKIIPNGINLSKNINIYENSFNLSIESYSEELKSVFSTR